MTTGTAATTLKLSRIGGHDRVTIPYPSAGIGRYLAGVFLLAWLGAWAYGEVAVLTQIILGEAFGFHVFWLIGWTVGGICAAVSAFQMLRPAEPETFTLETGGVRYDQGVPPGGIASEDDQTSTSWSDVMKRRVETVFTPDQLRTLNLRETKRGNRLTIDLQADRLEIARGATEPVRERLYVMLTRRYA